MTRIIALCGYPKAGKSEVQKILTARYGIKAVDDSAPLRDAAIHLYGLTEWHVSTQEGKASLVQVGKEALTVRKVLGELGKYLEKDDPFHLPRLAVRKCMEDDPESIYSFGSVRMNQPRFFKALGNAIVIEVTRKGCMAQDDFDEYDRDSIDLTIENILDPSAPAASRAKLEAVIADMLDPIFTPLEIESSEGENRSAA